MARPSDYPTLFGCGTGAGGAAVVLGVPYDRGSPPEHAGCALAPAALRRLSAPEHCRADLHGLWDRARRERIFAAGAVSDLGDIRFRSEAGDDSYLEKITDYLRVLVKEGKRPLVLGGDHLVTLAVLRGFAAAGRPVQVIQLDAHEDYHRIEPGERPTHASFVNYLMMEGLARQVLQVGIRGCSWGASEAPPGVTAVQASQVEAALLPGVPTYLTVDTDGFDPTLAGAVNFPEHEGLTAADLATVLAGVGQRSSLVGADWTEYNPRLDAANALTGRFIVRSLARIIRLLCAPPSKERT